MSLCKGVINMATIVNTPGSGGDGGGSGFLLGVIVLLVVVFIFIFYGLPMLRQSSTPQVNVPDKVDVNVNDGSQPQ